MCKTKKFAPHLNALLCVKKFLFGEYLGTWSSGMIPVLGTGGLGFDSRSTPLKIYISKYWILFIVLSKLCKIYFCK